MIEKRFSDSSILCTVPLIQSLVDQLSTVKPKKEMPSYMWWLNCNGETLHCMKAKFNVDSRPRGLIGQFIQREGGPLPEMMIIVNLDNAPDRLYFVTKEDRQKCFDAIHGKLLDKNAKWPTYCTMADEELAYYNKPNWIRVDDLNSDITRLQIAKFILEHTAVEVSQKDIYLNRHDIDPKRRIQADIEFRSYECAKRCRDILNLKKWPSVMDWQSERCQVQWTGLHKVWRGCSRFLLLRNLSHRVTEHKLNDFLLKTLSEQKTVKSFRGVMVANGKHFDISDPEQFLKDHVIHFVYFQPEDKEKRRMAYIAFKLIEEMHGVRRNRCSHGMCAIAGKALNGVMFEGYPLTVQFRERPPKLEGFKSRIQRKHYAITADENYIEEQKHRHRQQADWRIRFGEKALQIIKESKAVSTYGVWKWGDIEVLPKETDLNVMDAAKSKKRKLPKRISVLKALIQNVKFGANVKMVSSKRKKLNARKGITEKKIKETAMERTGPKKEMVQSVNIAETRAMEKSPRRNLEALKKDARKQKEKEKERKRERRKRKAEEKRVTGNVSRTSKVMAKKVIMKSVVHRKHNIIDTAIKQKAKQRQRTREEMIASGLFF